MSRKDRSMRIRSDYQIKLFKVIAVQRMMEVGLRSASGRFEKMSLSKACSECDVYIGTYQLWARQYESEGVLGLLDHRTKLYRDSLKWHRDRGEM